MLGWQGRPGIPILAARPKPRITRIAGQARGTHATLAGTAPVRCNARIMRCPSSSPGRCSARGLPTWCSASSASGAPLRAALAAGFIGQFAASEDRRTAFWFLIFAAPLMLAGHLAVHAVASADLRSLRLIGFYLLPASVIGVLAFPKSPLWAPLLLAPLFIALGYGCCSPPQPASFRPPRSGRGRGPRRSSRQTRCRWCRAAS